MTQDAVQSDIQAFLRRFWCAMDQKDGLVLWQTKKNQEFLLESGFTNTDIESVVRGLRVQDYSTGPEPDDDPQRPKGEVWKFSREFCGYLMYVKLKLQDGCNMSAECLSFHEAEKPMQQPHWPRRQ